jgi:hypothetical protein
MKARLADPGHERSPSPAGFGVVACRRRQ